MQTPLAAACDALMRAGLTVEREVAVREFTTFRIGGRAELLVVANAPEDVITASETARRFSVPMHCLGGGSNVLVSDDGVPGIVLINRIGHLRYDGALVRVGSGSSWDELVEATVERGLRGACAMSGIPGSVGGAIYGNAGAYGESVSDVLLSATVVNASGQTEVLSRDQLGFRYRSSRLKETGQIVVEATFRFAPDDRGALRARRETILSTRAAKHPRRTDATAGSFFKNIEKEAERKRLAEIMGLPDDDRRIAAGLLLDRAGARGMRVGDAEVFEKHANIIVNRGNATAREVLELSRRMRRRVLDAFGIGLEREVMWLGRAEPTGSR